MKVFFQLPEVSCRDYQEVKRARKKQFEPERQKVPVRCGTADMETLQELGLGDINFGEELKLLAEKAYPDLEDNACEQITLNRYLTSISYYPAGGILIQHAETDND